MSVMLEVDVQVQSPLWDAEPAAIDTVRAAVAAAPRRCRLPAR